MRLEKRYKELMDDFSRNCGPDYDRYSSCLVLLAKMEVFKELIDLCR